MINSGVKIAEINTTVEYPIETVRDAIKTIGRKSLNNGSGGTLITQDDLLGLYIFSVIIKNTTTLFPTMGRININLNKKDDNNTNITVNSNSNNSDYDNGGSLHVGNMQRAQTSVLLNISKVLRGEELKDAPIVPKDSGGCLSTLLLLIAVSSLLIYFVSK